MEKSNEDACSILDNRLKNILQTLTTCKKEYFNVKEECKSLKEINTKLETELKETRELEKSHRYHLATSREMIANLQDTVSKLVYLKRDTKKLKDELLSKDYTIAALEKEKTTILQMHDENITEMRNEHEKQIKDLKLEKEKKILQNQYECDTQIAQLTCTIEELRNQTKEMEAKSMEKMNVVVLEYEEKIQRGAAHIAQLQEQLAHQAARTDSNIDTYKRRVEDLEEKLKQSQFKQYLASSLYPTQYENTVERPYSANRDPYPSCSIDLDTNLEVKKPYYPTLSQNKTQKLNKLQVLDPNVKADKKGAFTITKKRKLYNEKDFSAF